MKKILLSLTLLFAATALWAQSAARKFSWANSADGQSVVYAYLPDASKATGRAVVDCPGGGYEHLAMDHEGHDWAAYFNDQGIDKGFLGDTFDQEIVRASANNK